MRDSYEKQLNKLDFELNEMARSVNSMMEGVVAVLKNNDIYLAEEIASSDAEIKELERKVESRCIKLIMKQQPVASDLRNISAAMKMVTDMERIGRQSVASAELLYFALKIKRLPDIENIRLMAEKTKEMVTFSIKSFIEQDENLAKKVIDSDDYVDNYFDLCKNNIIDILKAEKEDPEVMVNLLMLVKYLERIADHAVNVASWVKFAISGE